MSAHRSKKFHNLGVILDGISAEWGLQHEMDLFTLERHWSAVVGDSIARHSFPETIRFHKLTLGVDSAPWKNELLFFKADILKKTNGFLKKPLIQDVVFRIVSPYPQKTLFSPKTKDKRGVQGLKPVTDLLQPDIACFDEGINTLNDKALQGAIRQALLRYFSTFPGSPGP